MSIQHRLIPDSERHEPKGASTAAAKTVYASDGAGSGSFRRLDMSDLKNSTGDGGSSNKYLRTDGTNGITAKTDVALGVMGITNNTNAFAMTAAVDASLNTNSDYVLFTGTGAPWAGEQFFGGVVFSVDRVTVPVTGLYEILFWANITQFPTNTARVGCKYRVNGTTFGPRTVITKSNSAGDYGQINAFGTIPMSAGDFAQIYLASSASGGLIIGNANSTIKLIRET